MYPICCPRLCCNPVTTECMAGYEGSPSLSYDHVCEWSLIVISSHHSPFYTPSILGLPTRLVEDSYLSDEGLESSGMPPLEEMSNDEVEREQVPITWTLNLPPPPPTVTLVESIHRVMGYMDNVVISSCNHDRANPGFERVRYVMSMEISHQLVTQHWINLVLIPTTWSIDVQWWRVLVEL